MKAELSDAIYKELLPIQDKRRYFVDHKAEVDTIIKEGNEKAGKIAAETMREVREKMGLI